MSTTFDPYYRWLGIPPGEQPANHYRLLGLSLFEADREVIGIAADRQMVHVRTFQSGKYSTYSQQLLNEISAAELCLIDPARKAAYDEKLLTEQLLREQQQRMAQQHVVQQPLAQPQEDWRPFPDQAESQPPAAAPFPTYYATPAPFEQETHAPEAAELQASPAPSFELFSARPLSFPEYPQSAPEHYEYFPPAPGEEELTSPAWTNAAAAPAASSPPPLIHPVDHDSAGSTANWSEPYSAGAGLHPSLERIIANHLQGTNTLSANGGSTVYTEPAYVPQVGNESEAAWSRATADVQDIVSAPRRKRWTFPPALVALAAGMVVAWVAIQGGSIFKGTDKSKPQNQTIKKINPPSKPPEPAAEKTLNPPVAKETPHKSAEVVVQPESPAKLVSTTVKHPAEAPKSTLKEIVPSGGNEASENPAAETPAEMKPSTPNVATADKTVPLEVSPLPGMSLASTTPNPAGLENNAGPAKANLKNADSLRLWTALPNTPAIVSPPLEPIVIRELQQSWAKFTNNRVTKINSIDVRLALIPPGGFMMGSPEDEADRRDNEGPTHRVHLPRPFYLGTGEVTASQFDAFVKATGYVTDRERWLAKGEAAKELKRIMDRSTARRGNGSGKDQRAFQAGDADPDKLRTWRNPLYRQTVDSPVVNVTWGDAVAFCRWLTEKEGVKYRLPTEAEWEYACRNGTQTRHGYGDDDSLLSAFSWNAVNAGGQSHPIRLKRSNLWNLYDLEGNVWEWCQDHYADYSSAEAVDPQGPAEGDEMVIRGGGWAPALIPRAALRLPRARDDAGAAIGFRVVEEIPGPEAVQPK